MEYQSVNPFDGKTAKTFEPLTDAELEAKIAAATASRPPEALTRSR